MAASKSAAARAGAAQRRAALELGYKRSGAPSISRRAECSGYTHSLDFGRGKRIPYAKGRLDGCGGESAKPNSECGGRTGAAVLLIAKIFSIRAAGIGGPGLEPPLLIEDEGEVDIGFAVEQVAEIHAGALQVHGIDLEVSPIERAIGVVVIDLAGSARVLGALDRQRYAAGGAELVAGVLLVSREAVAELVGLGLGRFGVCDSLRNHKGPLQVDAQGRLQCEGIPRLQHHSGDACQNGQQSEQAGEPGPFWSRTPAPVTSLRPRLIGDCGGTHGIARAT